MYLTPNAVGDAELTIGGIDNSKFQGQYACSTIWRVFISLSCIREPQIRVPPRCIRRNMAADITPALRQWENNLASENKPHDHLRQWNKQHIILHQYCGGISSS